MSTYLLLRDNKESGPYSLEELSSKGLKAYDLVWIEGKSAAWRYPSEVEELKSFAPVVEEQPFDRFFKKSAQGNSSIMAQSRPTPEKENSFSSEPSSVPGKRIIYVTLPADRGSGMRMPSFREPAQIQAAVPLLETRTPLIEKEAGRAEFSSLYGKPAEAVEEKFSQPQGNLWKTAVEITPRQKAPDRRRFLQPVAAIVCILALLAAGIFIGLFIKGDSFGFSQKAAVKEGLTSSASALGQKDPPFAKTPIGQPASTLFLQGQAPSGINNKDNAVGTGSADPKTAASTATSLSSARAQKKNADKAKDRTSLANQKTYAFSLPARDSAVMTLPVVHREATHRTDETGIDKEAIKSSISGMVSVGSGKYTVGAFGGISDLQLTVSNRSHYPIDLVVVEVQYIQANKKVFKTENIYFRNLVPGSAIMQEAPKSSRGIKVQYRVALINSKELGLSYSGI